MKVPLRVGIAGTGNQSGKKRQLERQKAAISGNRLRCGVA